MIAGYAKNGRFDDAEKVFERMPVKDLVSYNSMLAGYAQNGKMGLAMQFFERMEETNVVSWNLMVAGFVNSCDLSSAWKLFERIPNPNAVSWVTMLCGFARHGKIVEARKLFDRMPCKNVVSWNAMIGAYVQDLQIDEAVKLFTEMPYKDCVSWTTIINGYVRVGKLDEAHKIYNQMPYKDIAAKTALMSGLIQNGRIDEASQVFSQLGKRDAICWNSMIAGYCQSGRMGEALNLFRQMPVKNAVSCNTMISGYAQSGQMDRAAEIFEAMVERNIISWNSLITGFLQNNLYLEALKSLVLMGKEGKKPDQSTFACSLSACANLAALQVGKQLHEYIMKSGYINDLFVSNALIAMYAKCGRVQSAEQVFKDIECVDLVSWNSLISGYALNGYANEAFWAFEQMLSEGMVPDEVTFIGMLSACSHAGLPSQGLDLFKCMIDDFAIEPLAEHYSCLVDLLGRMGRLEEAFNIVREMKVKANAGLWGSLLAACRVHKNMELGEIAAVRLLELEPHNASNYITLSNMHAEAGRWEEVERLRVLMRERRAGKLPGCSWIEVQNQIQHFVSDDPGKLRTENIQIILNTLSAQIRDKCNLSYMKSV
jgi:pentatricopeptide repeat protein